MKIIDLDKSVYELFFNNAVSGIAIASIDGLWLKANKSLCDMLGYGESELLNKTVQSVFHPIDADEFLLVLAQFADGRQDSCQSEKRLIHKSGRTIWASVSSSLICDDTDQPKYFVMQAKDISREKESDEIAKVVIASMFDGFWDWHFERDYQYMSPRFWRIIGYDEKEKTHHPSEWKKCILPEDLDAFVSSLSRHFETKGKEPFFQEARFLHKNGSVVWLICKGKVIEWGDHGQATRMVCTLTDISEVKRAQTAMVHNDKMATLGQMAGGIAHEINTPLATIELNVGAMEEFLASEKIHCEKIEGCLKRIRGTVKAMGRIIASLKRFSRDSSLVEHEIQPLKEIVEDALTLCQEKMRNAGIVLTIDVPPYLNVECKGIEIVHVVLNLLNNACHAIETLEKKEISIEAWSNFGKAFIAVSDNGVGVPEPIRKRIMDPYFTTKPAGTGTGLGLSISKGIVEAHGGRLYLDEASHKTRFCIELPEKCGMKAV